MADAPDMFCESCADKPQAADVVSAGYSWWPLGVQYQPTDHMPGDALAQLFAVLTTELQPYLAEVIVTVTRDKYLTQESKAAIEAVLATRMRSHARDAAPQAPEAQRAPPPGDEPQDAAADAHVGVPAGEPMTVTVSSHALLTCAQHDSLLLARHADACELWKLALTRLSERRSRTAAGARSRRGGRSRRWRRAAPDAAAPAARPAAVQARAGGRAGVLGRGAASILCAQHSADTGRRHQPDDPHAPHAAAAHDGASICTGVRCRCAAEHHTSTMHC